MRRTDEIPEAIRERPRKRGSNFPIILILIIIGSIGIALLSIVLNFLLSPHNPPATSSIVSPTQTSTIEASPKIDPPEKKVENILGHLPYTEANQKELKQITPDGHTRLRKAAAERFLAMQTDAKTQGIILVPISGFRSVQEQQYLFFKVKEQRKQATSKRAEVSAPPGYSEHHTGYAVDIGDGQAPSSNLNQNFEQTAAFSWLEKNANQYSFEMSFPVNNAQGVSYEPWHWRYVGDQNSLETFYKAQQLKKEVK